MKWLSKNVQQYETMHILRKKSKERVRDFCERIESQSQPKEK